MRLSVPPSPGCHGRRRGAGRCKAALLSPYAPQTPESGLLTPRSHLRKQSLREVTQPRDRFCLLLFFPRGPKDPVSLPLSAFPHCCAWSSTSAGRSSYFPATNRHLLYKSNSEPLAQWEWPFPPGCGCSPPTPRPSPPRAAPARPPSLPLTPPPPEMPPLRVAWLGRLCLIPQMEGVVPSPLPHSLHGAIIHQFACVCPELLKKIQLSQCLLALLCTMGLEVLFCS